MRRMTFDEFLWALTEVRDNGVYAKRLKELEEAQDTLTEKLGVFDSLQKVQQLEGVLIKERGDVAMSKKAQDEAHEDRKTKLELEYRKYRDEVSQREQRASAMSQALRLETEAIAKAKEELKKREAIVEQESKDVNKRIMEVTARENELKAKIAKMKELV